MKNTLYNKISKMLAALILLTTVVLLIVVWNSTSKSITESLTKRLALAESVVVREILSKQQTLIKDSHHLFEDYMLQDIIDDDKRADLTKAINTFRYLLDATFVSVHSIDGTAIASTGHLYGTFDQTSLVSSMKIAVEDGISSNLMVIEQHLVWMLYLPILNDVGKANSTLIMGFTIDELYLQSLKEIITLDVSLHVNSDKPFVVSSLPVEHQNIDYIEDSLVANNFTSWLYLNPLINSNTLFSRKFSQHGSAGFTNTFYISADGEAIKGQFLQLQLTIGAIALVALLIAIIAGHILSRQITRPLEYVANHVVKIAKGDYSQSISLESSSLEIDQLLHAFKTMESGVKQRESEIQFQAQHDMLTQLYNRNYFSQYLNTLFASKQFFQVVGINISGFRTINDVFGYQYGDDCVKELANRVKQYGGTSARVTGGEILWVPNTSLSLEEIERFKKSIDRVMVIDHITLSITSSIGVLNCPSDTHNAEDLYRRMNLVIDEAQLAQNSIAEFSHGIEDSYLRRLAIISNLRTALASNSKDLSLAYQPKIDLQTLFVNHAEALIRWNDKALGFVPPDEFIIIAEQAGIIDQVTTWVLGQVAHDITYFKAQGLDLCVAVNISAKDLLDDDFTSRTRLLLEKNNLNCSDISFELTESVIVQDPEKSIEQMQILRNEGFSLAIDDFGTGYSSLSYITQLPVDTIKIDKCFVIPLAANKDEQSICKAVLTLANHFNMQVVAEGVEDLPSMTLLKSWGCKYAQGYHISRPIPAQELTAWIKNSSMNTTCKAKIKTRNTCQ